MRSLAMVAVGQPLCEIVTETPSPQGTQVLVRVAHCGVCHSDLHLHDGYFDLGGGRRLNVYTEQQLPHTLGHEVQGEVVAAGPDAEGVSAGSVVAVYPWIGCGQCGLCTTGREHLCTASQAIGIRTPGGYADHVLVPHPRYLIPADDIDGALAACCMCSGITAYSAVRKLEAAVAAGPYMIVGLGGVGMMALQCALARYDRAPLVADIDPAKLEVALDLGAAAAYDLREPDIAKRIKKDSRGGLAGLADFVGAEATVKAGMSMMQQGGHIVIVGLVGGELSTPIPLLPMRALKIEGSYVGSLADAREVIDLVRAGRLKPIPISERPLDEANAVIEALRKGEIVGRCVLTP